MTKTIRVALVAMFALFGGLSVQAASAQMLHFNLDITIQTEDGANLPAGGTVCVSNVSGNDTCQDIGGNPSGRDFYFPGLSDGDHSVTISADPYLEIVDTVNLKNTDTSVSYTLQHEQTPPAAGTDTTPPAAGTTAQSLPVTGAGTTASTGGATAPLFMVLALLAVASLAGATVLGRKRR